MGASRWNETIMVKINVFVLQEVMDELHERGYALKGVDCTLTADRREQKMKTCGRKRRNF